MRSGVILVSPPCETVRRPNLGLGTLKPLVERLGVPVRIEYLNIAFAERIGLDLNELVAECELPPQLLLGDWLFATALRRDVDPEDLGVLARYAGLVSPERRTALAAARRLSPAFVAEEARRLCAAEPAIVGFSTTFAQTAASLALAAAVRALDPEVVICMGGANCEGPMGQAILEAFPQIDHVFSGEAELTFPPFVERVLAGKKPYTRSRSVYSRARAALPEPVAKPELDDLPIPDFADYFDALRRSSFAARVVPGIPIETSRGCWWGAVKHCRFCGLNGGSMAFRSKSAQRIEAELDAQHARWGATRFMAVDNIMGLDLVGGLFAELEARRAGYQFFYEIKSNMRFEDLARLARGGVRWLQPGVESLDDEILDLMQKGVSALQNVALLRHCRELGIQPAWNLLWGFPRERREHYQRMARLIPLLEHLDPPFRHARLRLDRFSPYHEDAARLGFVDVRPAPAYHAVYGLPEAVLSRLAYYFDGAPADLDPGDYTADARVAIERWQARHRGPERPPVLSLLRAGSLAAVEDTRTGAVSTWYFLEPLELSILEAFREPGDVERRLSRVAAAAADGAPAPGAFAHLVDLGFIVVDGRRAVTLVIDPERRVFTEREPFPLGRVEPGEPGSS